MNRKNLSISLIAALAAIFLAACGSSHKTVPPALMLTRHDRTNSFRRRHRDGALQAILQQAAFAVDCAILLGHGFAGVRSSQLTQPAAIATGQNDRPHIE